MTKPSRSTSNGLEMPSEEKAVIFVKPAMELPVNADSVPPAITTSHRSEAISLAALIIACVPAAQAVQVFSAGPLKPYFIETAADAAFGIIIGTRKGDTRLAPFSNSTPICSSRVSMPPIPVPMKTPDLSRSAVSSPA